MLVGHVGLRRQRRKEKKRRGRRTRGRREGSGKGKGKEESMSVVDLGGLSSQLQQHWQDQLQTLLWPSHHRRLQSKEANKTGCCFCFSRCGCSCGWNEGCLPVLSDPKRTQHLSSHLCLCYPSCDAQMLDCCRCCCCYCLLQQEMSLPAQERAEVTACLSPLNRTKEVQCGRSMKMTQSLRRPLLLLLVECRRTKTETRFLSSQRQTML